MIENEGHTTPQPLHALASRVQAEIAARVTTLAVSVEGDPWKTLFKVRFGGLNRLAMHVVSTLKEDWTDVATELSTLSRRERHLVGRYALEGCAGVPTRTRNPDNTVTIHPFYLVSPLEHTKDLRPGAPEEGQLLRVAGRQRLGGARIEANTSQVVPPPAVETVAYAQPIIEEVAPSPPIVVALQRLPVEEPTLTEEEKGYIGFMRRRAHSALFRLSRQGVDLSAPGVPVRRNARVMADHASRWSTSCNQGIADRQHLSHQYHWVETADSEATQSLEATQQYLQSLGQPPEAQQ